MTGRLLLVAACAVVPLAAGCDQCEHYGQLRCQGDMLQECIDDGDGPFANFRWVPRGCAVTCRQSGGSAACVDSREPVPECAGDPEGGICFEGAPSGCWDGYLRKGQPCGSNTHCVASAACGPICVAGDAPEPRCTQEFFCDGDAVASCECGYLKYRFSCTVGLSCQEMRGEPHCLSPAPDPRCGDPTRPFFSFCEANVYVSCWYGYVSAVADCATISSPPGRCEPINTPTGQPSCVTAI